MRIFIWNALNTFFLLCKFAIPAMKFAPVFFISIFIQFADSSLFPESGNIPRVGFYIPEDLSRSLIKIAIQYELERTVKSMITITTLFNGVFTNRGAL